MTLWPRSGKSRSLPFREILLLAGVLILAFGLRAWYIQQYLLLMPTALHPGNDAGMYWNLGRKIYLDGWLLPGEGPFYQAPLYAYFLAGMHHLGMHRIDEIIRAQALMGVANVLMTYALARSRMPSAWAAGAALLFGLGHYPVFFESKILAETLGLFLFLVFALLFTAWIQRSRIVYLPSAAFVFSLVILCRPNMLFTLPFLLFFVLCGFNHEFQMNITRRSLVHGGLFLAVFIAGVLPAPLRNYFVGGDLVPLAANSGVTLYMGTNPQAQGGLASVEGLSNNIEEQKEGGVALASRLAGRPLKPSEASNFWIKKTIAWAVTHPGAFLALQAKKLLWAFYYSPPAVNDSAQFENQWLPLVGFLSRVTWLTLFAGIAGLPFWLNRRDPVLGFFLCVWAGYLLLCLVYYSSDRFLMTVLPFLAIAALGALRRGYQAWVENPQTWMTNLSRKHLDGRAAWFLVIALLTANPFLAWNHGREIGIGYYNLGVQYDKAGDETLAMQYYEQGLEYLPDFPSLLLNLGVIQAQRGNLEVSTRLFEQVLRLDPQNQLAKDNLLINQQRQARKPS
ncbi:MAG: glycosyltransferase family 39 protein [bacterium]